MFEIAVIGCGAIGLTTALALQRCFKDSAKIVIYTKDTSPNTTSDVAAGLWTPYLIQNTPEEKIHQWSKETHDFLLELWQNGDAAEAGISIQPVMNIFDGSAEYELPKWLELTFGYTELSPTYLKHLSKLHQRKYVNGFCYVTFVWEASKFLPFLTKQFKGKIVRKEVTNFEELQSYDVVINCAGLEAKYLNQDSEVHPIRGQISRVLAPWQNTVLFIIQNGQKHYIIPNIDELIIGGTHQKNDFRTNVDKGDHKFIFDGCKAVVPSLANATFLKNQAGLRPGRDSVKLDFELKKLQNGKVIKLVHNYGHGGSGITLCIGCANDVVKIVKNIFGVNNKL